MPNPTALVYQEGKAAGFLGTAQETNPYARAVARGLADFNELVRSWDSGWQWRAALRAAGAPQAYSSFAELSAWRARSETASA
jgi:hypothetical protein